MSIVIYVSLSLLTLLSSPVGGCGPESKSLNPSRAHAVSMELAPEEVLGGRLDIFYSAYSIAML
jgi:hypothetical protein